MFGVVDKILETLCYDHIFTGVSIKAEKNSINILLKTRTFTSLCFVGRNLMLSRVPLQLLKV